MARADIARRYGERVVDTLTALAAYCNEAAIVVARGEAAFRTDLILQRAAEAIIARIGETVRHRLPAGLLEEYPGQPWRLIVAQRVQVAHGYDSIDYGILWSTLTVSVPELHEYLLGTMLAD